MNFRDTKNVIGRIMNPQPEALSESRIAGMINLTEADDDELEQIVAALGIVHIKSGDSDVGEKLTTDVGADTPIYVVSDGKGGLIASIGQPFPEEFKSKYGSGSVSGTEKTSVASEEEPAGEEPAGEESAGEEPAGEESAGSSEEEI